jgi:glycerate kinase
LKRWSQASIRVATDVTSPLLGSYGAAHVFSPQKGAAPDQVAILEQSMERYADVMEAATGKNIRNAPGAGAAGGTAFGISCAFGTDIMRGFQWLSSLLGLEEKIGRSDLVITAEGRFDSQSLVGKATGELARLCKKHAKPLWVIPATSETDLDWKDYGVELVQDATSQGQAADPILLENIVAKILKKKIEDIWISKS